MPDEIGYDLKYYYRHHEENKAKMRAYMKANPHIQKAGKERASAKFFGVSLEEYRRLRSTEVCDICGRPFSDLAKRHQHIDHNHVTKQVRGVLCHYCNLALGHMMDNPELLRKAADYLEKSNDQFIQPTSAPVPDPVGAGN